MILCQKCGTVNSLDEDTCHQCGSRLMLLAQGHQVGGSLPMMDEHLLERISTLEHSTGRLEEKIGHLYNMIEQSAGNSLPNQNLRPLRTGNSASSGVAPPVAAALGNKRGARTFRASQEGIPECFSREG